MPTAHYSRIATTLQDRATTDRVRSFVVPVSFTSNQHPPLFILLDNIFFFPLAWRKFIVEFCRIQKDIISNIHLNTSFQILEETSSVQVLIPNRIHPFKYTYEKEHLQGLLCCLIGSPTSLSLLSYFARAEKTCFVDQFKKLRSESLQKELDAATNATSIPQMLDYSMIFGLPNLGLFSIGGSQRLSELLRRGLSTLKASFQTETQLVFLPVYNKRKNIAYSSQVDFLHRVYGYDNGNRSINTLDLLRLYQNTGYRVSGPMELRQAWFYNDLKPRTYYCNGGDSYFNTLYIQDIANAICKLLPSTNPETRFEVSRIGPVPDGAFLVTYDYSSFTSSLAELKYFMFWLAEYFKGTLIDVFDPVLGVVSIDLGQYLHDYNTYANNCMAFDGCRFSSIFEHPIFHMGLAGALGVKGNIVFSTTLHGVSLADITGRPDYDCVVGDDALCYVFAHMFSIFIRLVNKLGVINPDKFSRVMRVQEDPGLHSSFKFLKRPLALTPDNIPFLGLLDFFPDVASVLFPEGDGFHTVVPGTDHPSRVESFIKSLCRYSLIVSRHMTSEGYDAQIYFDELDRLAALFRSCYERLGLDPEGSAPGSIIPDVTDEGGHLEVNYFVPPMHGPDVFLHGWVEVCFWKFQYHEIKREMTASNLPPPLEVVEGSEFIASSDIKPLQLLVDLEFLHKTLLFEMVVFDEDYKARLLFLGMHTQTEYKPVLSSYKVVKTHMSWYDLFHPYQLDTDSHTILDNVSTLSSVFE